jgi:hypothetical protein
LAAFAVFLAFFAATSFSPRSPRLFSARSAFKPLLRATGSSEPVSQPILGRARLYRSRRNQCSAGVPAGCREGVSPSHSRLGRARLHRPLKKSRFVSGPRFSGAVSPVTSTPLQGLRSDLSFLPVFSAIPLKAATDAALAAEVHPVNAFSLRPLRLKSFLGTGDSQLALRLTALRSRSHPGGTLPAST